MPVRLLRPYAGQPAGTMYFGPDENLLRGTIADDRIELATDYAPSTRIVTTATANVVQSATLYVMNSATAQMLTLPTTGYLPTTSILTIIPIGAGAVTITAASGVTILTAASSLVSKAQYGPIQLIKTAANDTWVAYGNLGG